MPHESRFFKKVSRASGRVSGAQTGFVQILENWKVLEFDVEIFQALKSLENDHRYGKVWKNP